MTPEAESNDKTTPAGFDELLVERLRKVVSGVVRAEPLPDLTAETEGLREDQADFKPMSFELCREATRSDAVNIVCEVDYRNPGRHRQIV
jgi:hypothetical protein